MVLYLSKFARNHFDVLLHTALVIFPLIAFTAILTGLVYMNMWDRSNTRTDDLPLGSGYFSDTLYVKYSATSLILVASWSSSVAVPLIGSLLTLVSFVVAADMVWMSEKSYQNLLPTPAQLGVLTDLLDGKKMALLTWLSGMWRRGDQKVLSRWVIELPAGIQLAGLFIRCVPSCPWVCGCKELLKLRLLIANQSSNNRGRYMVARGDIVQLIMVPRRD